LQPADCRRKLSTVIALVNATLIYARGGRYANFEIALMERESQRERDYNRRHGHRTANYGLDEHFTGRKLLTL
jgi:hypothetical protein